MEFLSRGWKDKAKLDRKADFAQQQAMVTPLLACRPAALPPRPSSAVEVAYQAAEAALLADDLPLAAELFGRLVAAAPSFVPGLLGLSHVLFYQQQPIRALALTNRAYRVDPDHIPVYEMYTLLLHYLDYYPQVIDWAERGLALDPTAPNLLNNLALAHYVLENYLAALAAFRRLLAVQPENVNAAHLVATLSGENPARASAAFVRHHFNSFLNFDQKLTTMLHYDVPVRLAALLAEVVPPEPAPAWQVIDLGCGTGLAGQALAPWAQTLTGVDLAGELLKTAATRGYTSLHEVDLLDWLATADPATAELVVAADVLIYLGDLRTLFAGLARVLKPGGYFLASTEDLDPTNPTETGFFLKKSSRYGQSAAYLAVLAQTHGLVAVRHVAAPLREDRNQPVAGSLWLWQKT